MFGSSHLRFPISNQTTQIVLKVFDYFCPTEEDTYIVSKFQKLFDLPNHRPIYTRLHRIIFFSMVAMEDTTYETI